MASISTLFNRQCKQKYHSLGFVQEHKFFVRKQGDILQMFSLKKRVGENVYTVEFGVCPMCASTPPMLPVGIYELDRFEIAQCAYIGGWKNQSISAMCDQECLDAIGEAMDKYLIPFFNRCCDCESTLNERNLLEEVFEKNRLEGLKILGLNNCAPPSNRNHLLYSPDKYYLALKAQNYDYVHCFLSFQICYHEERLLEFECPGKPVQPEIVKKRFAQDLEFYQEHLKRLNMQDFGFFDEIVRSNEKQMLQFLLKYYPRILNMS